MIRLGIPIIGGSGWLGGVSYVEHLARSIAALGKDTELEPYLVARPDGLENLELHKPFLQLFRKVIFVLPDGVPAPAETDHTAFCHGNKDLFRHIDCLFPLLAETWEGFPAPSWIPDFQHRFLPQLFSPREITERDQAYGRIAEKSRMVVFSSRTSEAHFRKFYPNSPAQTRVLSFHSWPTEGSTKEEAASVARRYGLPDRFLLCCNQFWSHKDHGTLFRALEICRQKRLEITLACTGAAHDYRNPQYFDSLKNEIKKSGVETQIRFLGTIPRADQVALMRRSFAMIQPSLFEGWSTVVEDGRTFGKRIFLSDLEVHLEQNPPGAFFFKAGKPEDLARVLLQEAPKLIPGPDFPAEAEAGTEARKQVLELGKTLQIIVRDCLAIQKLPPPVLRRTHDAPNTFLLPSFLETITTLAENGRWQEAGEFYRNNRAWFTDTPELARLDGLVKKFAGDTTLNLAIPPHTILNPDEGYVSRKNYRQKDYLITAIVSAYKSGAFIRDCLSDLENQTIADRLEIVVIDANSPDHERAVVEEFQEKFDNILYFRTPTRIGVYPAWNMAIQAATGKYITPFSTNDRLRKDAHEILARTLDENPDIALAYGDSYLTEKPHETFEKFTPTRAYGGVFKWPVYSFEDLLLECRVGPHPMWRKSVHAAVGYADERFQSIGDQDFFIRVGEQFELKHLDVFTGLYWISPDALSIQGEGPKSEIAAIRGKYIRKHRERLARFRSQAAPAQGVEFSFVTLVNDPEKYKAFKASLLAECAHPESIELLPVEEAPSAAAGYNFALEQAKGKYVVFCHQDILCEFQWLERLRDVLAQLERHDPNFGVAGVAGNRFEMVGREPRFESISYEIQSSHHQGRPFDELVTADEFCFLIRRGSGLSFDANAVTHFHFYGADISLAAKARGMKNYALNVPTMHLSDGTGNVRSEYDIFRREARALYEKWRDKFPIFGTTTTWFVNGKIVYLLGHKENLEPKEETLETAAAANGLKVSVVILSYNNWKLTEQCLKSIFETVRTPGFEVVVVDNGSTDGTREGLKGWIGRVKVHLNGENLGFAKGCNQGAALASGEILVFLNNDTIALPGWLDPLLEDLNDPAVAAAGPKLLFENRTLQHAGVVFGPNNLPYHLYHHFPENYKAAGLRREFQAVTGACLAVRKADVVRLGGFDEGFVNGWEDIDFCLRLKNEGRKIVYDPRSVLFHLEGKSAGRDDQREANHKHFTAKWEKANLWDDYRFFLNDRALRADDPSGFHIVLLHRENRSPLAFFLTLFGFLYCLPFKFRVTVLVEGDPGHLSGLGKIFNGAIKVISIGPGQIGSALQQAVTDVAAPRIFFMETEKILVDRIDWFFAHMAKLDAGVVEIPTLDGKSPYDPGRIVVEPVGELKETAFFAHKSALMNGRQNGHRDFPGAVLDLLNSGAPRRFRTANFFVKPNPEAV